MKHVKVICLAAVATGFLCFGFSQEISVFAADQDPCATDVAKFCKDVPQKPGAIMKCLEQHEGQLSDACRAHEAKMERTRMESREIAMQQRKFRQACKEYLDKFCKDATSAQGGPVKCLQEHENELSAPCIDTMKAMEEHKE